jgi:hypothetical protein
MPLTGFESAIPESQKSQTRFLNRVATRIESIQPDFLNNNLQLIAAFSVL